QPVATGLVTSKTDAAGRTVTYTYYPDGKLWTRSWARDGGAVVTTYRYDERTGQLEQVNYPSGSGMANVAIGYTDFGGVQTVTDAAGTRTIVYDAYLQPAIERFDASSIYGEMALSTHNFNTIAQGQVTATFGRLARI